MYNDKRTSTFVFNFIDTTKYRTKRNVLLCQSRLGKRIWQVQRHPWKCFKQYTGVKKQTGLQWSCDVGYERFLGPEVCFNPEVLISDCTTLLPDVVDEAIVKCPIDARRGLYKIIVLSGGTSVYKDFGRRLQSDIKRNVGVRT